MDDTDTNRIAGNNLVDDAAASATEALESAKSAADDLLDSAADRVEKVRATWSPALERALRPLEPVLQFTREQPVLALLAAFAVGASIAAFLGGHRRHRDG